MKIQNRLSIYNSLVFGIIFAIVAILIYGLFYRYSERAVYNNLENSVYITALFYLEEDELNKDEFSKIRKQFESNVNNTFYQFYNKTDSIYYGSNYLPVSKKILNQIRTKGSLKFKDEEFFCYGILYKDNQGEFVVVSREKQETVNGQLTMLIWILSIGYTFGTLAIIILSRWMSNLAYRPFRQVISQVNNISINNLDISIESPETRDELQDLIDTFNSLLARISDTFSIQKNFVSYVSHEFKTPLAILQGNLEVFAMKDHSPEEYRILSAKMLQQIVQLEEIINTLIIISDLRNGTDISSQFRIDEIIWEIIAKVSKQYPSAEIAVNINVSTENQHLLLVSIDRTQILMALFNLIENAVKFSSKKPVDIVLFSENDMLCITILDKGIGIPTEKMININKPFYRGDNTTSVAGSGIGLSIALRILDKNKIRYNLESQINEGTKITIVFDQSQK